MKHINLFCFLLLTTLSFSCIKEELDLCGTSLYFSYTGDENREIFPDKIGKVNLFVYNINDALVETIELNQNDLKRQQGTYLNLPDGQYKIVCWGNPYTDTQINSPSTRGLATVASPHYYTREIITTNDSLYIGTKKIEVYNNRTNEDTVHFSSSHIKMQIEITGKDNFNMTKANSMPISIEVGNLNPTVDFDKHFKKESISYFPLIAPKENTTDYISRFNVLRFEDENDISVKLVSNETNDTLYTLNLQQFMKENRISVNGKNEILIGIRFRFNGTEIIVTPWKEEDIRPGIG